MSKALEKSASLGKRLATLERECEALKDQVLGLRPVTKDWRATVGTMPDDELTRSAYRRGAAWRKRQKLP